MKRVITMVLALVMVVCAVGAFAEEGKDDYKQNLATMYLLYEILPKAILPDHVIYIYLNLIGYFNEEMMNLYYKMYPEKTGEDLYYSIKSAAESSAKNIKQITDVYNEWLEGKTTYMNCAESLMKVVETIVE